jgi:hypothetical protein
MRFMVEVISICGGLSDFLGAFSSERTFSASAVSVSVSVVLRGAKHLQTDCTFGGTLTAADVGIGLVD